MWDTDFQTKGHNGDDNYGCKIGVALGNDKPSTITGMLNYASMGGNKNQNPIAKGACSKQQIQMNKEQRECQFSKCEHTWDDNNNTTTTKTKAGTFFVRYRKKVSSWFNSWFQMGSFTVSNAKPRTLAPKAVLKKTVFAWLLCIRSFRTGESLIIRLRLSKSFCLSLTFSSITWVTFGSSWGEVV